MVMEALRQYDLYLAPAVRQQTSVRIATLLAHFYVANMPASLQTAVMTDWLDELSEFPAWSIQKACRDWLRDERRRPTLADIVERCEATTQNAKTERWVLDRFLENRGPDPDQVGK